MDYNLEIMKAEDEYWNDLRHLKDTIRVTLDKATGLTCFHESQDSTSVLTAILFFKNEPDIKFSFDVAIVTRNNNGTYMRLVHNKNAIFTLNGYSDQYTWNEVPSSHNVKEKADKIASKAVSAYAQAIIGSALKETSKVTVSPILTEFLVTFGL